MITRGPTTPVSLLVFRAEQGLDHRRRTLRDAKSGRSWVFSVSAVMVACVLVTGLIACAPVWAGPGQEQAAPEANSPSASEAVFISDARKGAERTSVDAADSEAQAISEEAAAPGGSTEGSGDSRGAGSVPEWLSEAFERLVADDTSARDRRRAAEQLVGHHQPDEAEGVARLLRKALSSRYGSTVWGATLKTLALHPTPPPRELLPTLLDMDERVGGSLQRDLGAAISRLMDDQLARTLARHAWDGSRSEGARRVATFALAHHRTQETAELLIKLTDPTQPTAVQDAAFAALQILTGHLSFDTNRAAWLDWWDQAKRLSTRQWREAVLDNLGRQAEQHLDDREQLARRLQKMVRRQYRDATAEERPAMLASLLSDSLEPVREMAITLAVQRLVDGGSFDAPLREGLRDRLDDTASSIRQRVTLLLRDLADRPAADRVAQRLVAGVESDVTVLRVDLLMLTRLPQAAAVDPVTAMLDHPSLRGEAAGMLAAAAEAGLISNTQRQRIADRVRVGLNDDAPPLPNVVSLLGRVGSEADWQRIVEWLDTEDGAVKRAAAGAWAQSDRPLEPLAQRASDPQIGPVFVLAAARRGHTEDTLQALIAHRPESGTQLENWRRALASMAERTPADVVMTGVDRLKAQGIDPALREAMLTAAIQRSDAALAVVKLDEAGAPESAVDDSSDLPGSTGTPTANDADADTDDQPTAQDASDNPSSDSADDADDVDADDELQAPEPVSSQVPNPQLVLSPGMPLVLPDPVEPAMLARQIEQHAALLVMRGAVRLEGDRGELAERDFQSVVQVGEALPDKLHREAMLGLMRAYLQTDDLARAAALAELQLTESEVNPLDAPAVVSCFLHAADDCFKADELDQAQAIVEMLRELIATADSATLVDAGEQINQFEQQLHDATEQAANGESSPAQSEDDAPTEPAATQPRGADAKAEGDGDTAAEAEAEAEAEPAAAETDSSMR